MKFINSCRTLAIAVVGGLVVGAGTAHAAGTVALSYDVSQRTPGYVAFDLKVRNIGQYGIQDVRVATADGRVPTLYFNDLGAGTEGAQPATFSWDPAGERPNLVWETSYYDASGVSHVEISEE